jgi:hypothetical protein
MYCRRAPASRPGSAARTSRTATVVWLPARAGWRIKRAAVLSDHGRGPCACRGTGDVHACWTRCWRGLAGSAGAACPPAPRGSLRSAVGQMVFYCWAVCRGSGPVEGFPWLGRPRGWAQLGSRSPGLPLAAAVFRPGKATHGNLRSLLRQGQASLRSVLRSLDTRSLRLASRRKDGKKTAATSRLTARGA